MFLGGVISGNFLRLSADSITGSVGDDVREWKDTSGKHYDVAVSEDCGTPKLGRASWDSNIPVIKFGHSGSQTCFKTTSAHPVSTSGTYVAVVAWTGYGGLWDPIACVSHDRYWSLRFFWGSNQLNMHVRNEQVPRVEVDHYVYKKPYVVVGRVDDSEKKSYMWVWDIKGNSWKGKEVANTAGIPSGGNEIITIGRATKYLDNWMQGEIAAYTMWDRFLSDSEVEDLVAQYSKNMGQGQQDTTSMI